MENLRSKFLYILLVNRFSFLHFRAYIWDPPSCELPLALFIYWWKWPSCLRYGSIEPTLFFLSSFSHIPSLILNGYAIFPWQINHSILNFPLSPIEPKDNIYLAAILVFNMNSGVPLSTLSWKVHFTRLIQMATCKTGKSSLKIMIFKQNLSLWNWFRPNSDHYDPRNEYCHFSILDNYLALKIFNLWLVLH